MMSNSLLEYKLDLVARQLNAYVIEDVATVMRRQFTREDGVAVDVVDFYPPWNDSGTFGKHKIAHEYMDTDWQRERFARYAGMQVDALPVYESGTALKRNAVNPHRCEVAIRPFRLMVQPRQDSDGNDMKTLILRYLAHPDARNWRPPTAPAAPTSNGHATNGHVTNGHATNGNGRAATNGHVGQTPVGAPTATPTPAAVASPPAIQPPLAQPAPTAVPQQRVQANGMVVPHFQMARGAQTMPEFDYFTTMHLINHPFIAGDIDSVARIGRIREGVDANFQPGRDVEGQAAVAMIAAVETYMTTRLDLEAAGAPTTKAHKDAKIAARRAYGRGTS